MADFFVLEQGEDKLIQREEKIAADSVKILPNINYDVITPSSNAPRLKIKFFLDAIEYTNPYNNTSYLYQVGQYFELEDYESCKILLPYGHVNFLYRCTTNNTGNHGCAFTTTDDSILSFYISSVIFEDSFYNSETAWLNPNNPDNIIDLIDYDYDYIQLKPYCNVYTSGLLSEIVNNFKIIYDDNFITIGVYKYTGDQYFFSFSPKNLYAPVSASALTGQSLIESHFGDSGTGTASTPVLSTAQYYQNASPSIILPDVLNAPTTPSFYITSNIVGGWSHKCDHLMWKAVNGYTYCIAFDFFYFLATNSYNLGGVVYYKGKSLTDKSNIDIPVIVEPEPDPREDDDDMYSDWKDLVLNVDYTSNLTQHFKNPRARLNGNKEIQLSLDINETNPSGTFTLMSLNTEDSRSIFYGLKFEGIQPIFGVPSSGSGNKYGYLKDKDLLLYKSTTYNIEAGVYYIKFYAIN